MAPTIGRVALDNGFHGSIPGDWVAPPPQNIHALQIISYLQFFKAQKRNLPSYKMAVDKCDYADLQFTKLYQQNKKQRVFINSITKTRYRKL